MTNADNTTVALKRDTWKRLSKYKLDNDYNSFDELMRSELLTED